MVESQSLGAYLEQELDWPGMRVSGRIRRRRKGLWQAEWEHEETWYWVSSLPWEPEMASRVNHILRGYWTIENGLFWVRDVSYGEDRLHGRRIGFCLSMLRNVAISLIRQAGYLYIPQGRRDIDCHPDLGLSFLQHPI